MKITKSRAIEILQRQLGPIDALNQQSGGGPDFRGWHRDTSVAIRYVFGESSRHVEDFTGISYVSWNLNTNSTEASRFYKSGLETARAILRSMLQEVEEYWDDDIVPTPLAPASPDENAPTTPATRDVFVVHGHDEALREMTARLLSRLGLNPIILLEQADRGRTIIEKFEAHSGVAFAVVLLTPDDVGASAADATSLKPRARQNVILELGYFAAKLGRGNVCGLYKGHLELPSDWQGIIYTRVDDGGAWQFQLARELKAAGLDVDLNKIA